MLDISKHVVFVYEYLLSALRVDMMYFWDFILAQVYHTVYEYLLSALKVDMMYFCDFNIALITLCMSTFSLLSELI